MYQLFTYVDYTMCMTKNIPEKVKNIKSTPNTKLENGGESCLFPLSRLTNVPNGI